MTSPKNLAPAIRASLNARLERLLDRPIIARIVDFETDAEDESAPAVFAALQRAARAVRSAANSARRTDAWREDPEDGTCSVRISLDYDDLWRGCESEILETVSSTVEGAVAFLTDEQRALLERSAREFLALHPPPESAELVSFEAETIGGSTRVTELRVAAAPVSRTRIRHVAIVPNLVQIERQLDALQTIEVATDDGPLAALRLLVGIGDSASPSMRCFTARDVGREVGARDETLDEYQAECINKALATPHFAVIHGPPGSGKTTVITGIIRRALDQGETVLVVSPTHVAVDNVVEKLVPRENASGEDLLEACSLPVRYAARAKKLSDSALGYWVGSKKQRRCATISRRVQNRLIETIPFAKALFAMEDTDAPGSAPLSFPIARVEAVICGTPIGILSYGPVNAAGPGTFDLLIVDEVSKMTLPEFLAIAVKARRWVLVGDPEQLPPYNNSEENGTTLDDVLEPMLELVCSVGAILERAKPRVRRDERLVVVSSDPARAANAIRAHIGAVKLDNCPSVALREAAQEPGIVVCSRDEVVEACTLLSPARGLDRTHNPDNRGTVRILAERGLDLPRPVFASGMRLVDPRVRAQALIFETSFNVYHAQPWSIRSNQRLPIVSFRNGLEKYLPSVAALDALDHIVQTDAPSTTRRHELVDAIAERFVVNTVSVYDWLTGIHTSHFDASPLLELGALAPACLCDAVRPFVGTLKKQYRMDPSLSQVPRELFYFGDALHDGVSDATPSCRVRFLQVDGESDEGGESNANEIKAICDVLAKLNSDDAVQERRPSIMVITPYRRQEERLRDAVELRARDALGNLDVEVCTLDRCQGREAEYVVISLVKSRATPFLDMPKRWNVALTRAKSGLFIAGNVDAYLNEAMLARRSLRAQPTARDGDGQARPARLQMSLLARIIEAYDRQIAESGQTSARRSTR